MGNVSGQQRTFYFFLLAVFLMHGAFMAVKLKNEWGKSSWAPAVPQAAPIKVEFLPQSLRSAALQSKKQIVESEDSADRIKTDNAFLSDKDRKFDRQTMAKNVDKFNQAAKGNASVSRKAELKQAGETTKSPAKELKLSDIGIGAGEVMPKKEMVRAPASASQAGTENGNPANQGLSATNDYVQEVALGDFTHLNTVEYKFYGFYHRIRQKLEQFWGNSIQEKAQALFRSGRRIPASEDLITSLQITLNSKGEIIGVKVLGTSGVKELDDAAIESFNQAGPFPNPPQDLLVNGKATIEWGFVVKG